MHSGRSTPLPRPAGVALRHCKRANAANACGVRRGAVGAAAGLARGGAHGACAGKADADGRPGSRPTPVRAAYFFPYAETLVQHAAPQQHEATRDGLTLRIKRSALSVSPPATAGGVLVVEEGQGANAARRAYDLANVTVGQAPAGSTQPASLAAVLQAAAFALLGGLILNLMPCVFPVLSIKVLGLIDQAGQSRARVRKHGMAYTAGVLVAFTALASLLLAVRAAGTQVGWGFQLQSPATVAILAYVLFAVGLNLSGVFHLGSSLQGIGQRAALSTGLAGSFSARRAGGGGGDALHGPVHGDRRGVRAHATRRRQPCRVPRARVGPGPAVPRPDSGAGPGQPPAAARRLDGDAAAASRLPRLCHGGLADLGAGPAGGIDRPVGRPHRVGADRPCRMVVQRPANIERLGPASCRRHGGRLARRRSRRRRGPGAAPALTGRPMADGVGGGNRAFQPAAPR